MKLSKKSGPLKVDLHVHTGEDPLHLHRIRYTARELISMAADQGYDALAITNHECLTFNQKLSAYARERGILLIPGIELTVRNRHVLLLNPRSDKLPSDFTSLAAARRPDSLIVAPHPYFPNPHSLNGYVLKHLKLFDAIEYCHFYSPRINFNQKALAVSRHYGLPLMGNSDAHFPDQFGTTFSLIDAEKDPEAIFAAIREKRLEVVTRPLTPVHMGFILARFLTMKLQRRRMKVLRRSSIRFRNRPYVRIGSPPSGYGSSVSD